MSSQQQQSPLNNVINIFLDIFFQQTAEDERACESSWSNMTDSICLKEVTHKQQLNSCSCSDEQHQYLISAKQHEANEYFKQSQDSKVKYYQQQNMIKNILKSFLKYLVKLQDVNTIQKYEQMYSKQTKTSFSEIKKIVSKRINIKTNRWNFQLNSILQSERLSSIFYDYLIQQSESWLQQSKVNNTNQHKQLINQILICIQNNQPLKLKVYKKKK